MKKGIAFYEHKDGRSLAPSKTDASIVVRGRTFVFGVVVLCDDGEFRVTNTKHKNEISRRRMRAELKREGFLNQKEERK